MPGISTTTAQIANVTTDIGLGYFLDRVELIQLHKERFHIYLS